MRNKEDLLNELKKICRKIINGIAVVILTIVLGANLIRTSKVVYEYSEHVTYTCSFDYLLFIPIILLCLFVGLRLFTSTEQWKLFRNLTIVYIVAGMYWILNTENFLQVDNFLKADAGKIWSAAIDIRSGSLSSLHYYQRL